MKKESITVQTNKRGKLCEGCDLFKKNNIYELLKDCIGYCDSENPHYLDRYPETCPDYRPKLEGF